MEPPQIKIGADHHCSNFVRLKRFGLIRISFVFRRKNVVFGFCLAVITLCCASCGRNASPKFRQYHIQGEQLYVKHCSNCHQADGSGLGRLYPPLNKSDFMENHFDAVICLIRHGKSGEMIVNGMQYNQPMPGVATLSDLEIAEIATYIYNSWRHDRGLIEVGEVSKILAECDSVSAGD